MGNEMVTQTAQVAADIANTAAPVAAQVIQDQNFIQWFAMFMDQGGIFMWFIAAVWALGVAIAIERVKTLFRFDTDGTSLMNLIKKHVLLNDVHKAIQLCSDTQAALPRVLRSGLKRANQSREQIQDAIEASMLEVIPQLDKRLSYLTLIANLSTLMGLLGTIQGLIQSFSAVATADPSQKAQLLANGISTAMNTTALGLVSAISIMVVHSILISKTDKIVSEVEENSVKLIDLLGTKKRDVNTNEEQAA
jgi:biopolymer transport protein ExbB